MDLAGLISSFGGNLGLFAGMSLITIVQALAHLVYACGGALMLKQQRRQVLNSSPVSDHQSDLRKTEEQQQKEPMHHTSAGMTKPVTGDKKVLPDVMPDAYEQVVILPEAPRPIHL